MRRLIWIGLVFSLANCADVSTLQTARTLPKKKVRAVIGGGYYESSAVNAAVSSGSSTTTSLKFPFLNGHFRIGLTDNLDIGGRLTLPGQLGADGKYQFVDAGGFAAAVGLGLSYLALTATTTTTSGKPDDNRVTASFFDVTVPLFFSYDVSDWFAPYVSPKALFRFQSGGSLAYLGGTAGIKLGNRVGIFFEGSYLKANKSGATDAITQVNGGVFFGNATTYGESRDVVDGPTAAPVSTVPSVINVSESNRRLVLISASWAVGREACVWRAGARLGCGKITKVTAHGAMLLLNKDVPKVLVGDEVREPNAL